MREYAEEGIRHFYFMMLQKDEVIDIAIWKVFLADFSFSSLMLRSVEGLDVSQTIAVVRTAMSLSGLLGSTLGWEFLQKEKFSKMKN